MPQLPRPAPRRWTISGEVDAKDVATRAVIPSVPMATWPPLERVAETIATARKRFGAHAHSRQEVLIYLIEGEARHSAGTGPGEELVAGSMVYVAAGVSTAHAVNPRPGATARWFSIVAALPEGAPATATVRVDRPAESDVQPDGTSVTSLIGPGSSLTSLVGLEVSVLRFHAQGTAFRRVGPGHRSVVYALAGRGSVDNFPLETGEAALVEDAAAVSISGSEDFRVVHATVPRTN